MKKFSLYMFVFVLSLGAVSFVRAQDTASARPGITADSSFFFVDRLGETLQQFFTFNSEAKARLRMEIVDERVAELRVLLENDDSDEEAISRTQQILERTLNRVPENAREFTSRDVEIQNLDDRLAGVQSRVRSLPSTSLSQEVDDSVSRVRNRVRIVSDSFDNDDAQDALDAILDASQERLKARQRISREQSRGADVSVALEAYQKGDQALSNAQEAFDADGFEKAESYADEARRYFNQAREGGNFEDDDLDDDSNDDNSNDDSSSNNNSVVICHYPQSANEGVRPLTISVSEQAWLNAHSKHEGDHLGVCDLSQQNNSDDDDSDDSDDSDDDSDDGQMEIEADVFLDTTIVKVEINDVKTYFETSADTRETIITAVAEQFNLSEELVADLIEIEFEDRASRPSDSMDDDEDEDEDDENNDSSDSDDDDSDDDEDEEDDDEDGSDDTN